MPITRARTQPIVFAGARVARSAYNARYRTLCVQGQHVESVAMTGAASPDLQPSNSISIDLSGYLVLPGLINAHDHLDFSLFPRLGRGPHRSWREWGAQIHRSYRAIIDETLRVPRDVRFWWGGIRNLLCGVTTVSHHNPSTPEILNPEFPVDVPHEYGWAHSLADAERLGHRFCQTPLEWPFILHLAEGTDEESHNEFDVLDRMLPLDGRILMVHCVALTSTHWDRAERIGAGVIWCPSSNLYTLGKTLRPEQVKTFPHLALGSDSPLSGVGDLLDEVRLAHDEMGIPAPLLYECVTSRPARLLRLRSGQGALQPRCKADLIVVRDRQLTPAQTLVQLSWSDVELVMLAGRIVLASPVLAAAIPDQLKHGMQTLIINDVERRVRAPIADLWMHAFAALGRAPLLCGRLLSVGRVPASFWRPFADVTALRHDCHPNVI